MVNPFDAARDRTMFGRTIFSAVSLAALAFAAAPAGAQLVATDPSSNSVLIDLGAIDGGAPAYGTIGSASRFGGSLGTGGTGGQLLLPPQSTPSSRLLGPDGRPLNVALPPAAMAEPRAAQPQSQPKAAPKAATRPEPAPRLAPPPLALPAAPTPPKDGGPVALNSPAPAPNIPPMQLVGPESQPKAEQQAAVTPQSTAPAQPKAAPVQPQAQPKAPPASKGPTPTPNVAPPPPADAAPSAPPAAAQPKAQPKAEQQAALPPAQKSAPAAKGAVPKNIEVLFAAGSADLSSDAQATLDKLADSLKGDEKSRLQLLAYANEDQASPSKSRRMSLSRALAVRSHLIAKGIRSTRIDVRALGDQVPGGDPNRVDLQISDR